MYVDIKVVVTANALTLISLSIFMVNTLIRTRHGLSALSSNSRLMEVNLNIIYRALL